MRTIEVPAAERVKVLAEFSARHDGWLVSLDILDPAMGAQPEIDNVPLVGVWADRNGSIVISAARSPSEHITHTIEKPTGVFIERREDGADVALGIEAADGTKTILRFRVATLPETLDGVAHA